VELLPEWRTEMARLAVANREGPDPNVLKEKQRRLDKVYLRGRMSDAEYEAQLDEIDAQLRLTNPMELPTLEEAAQLFENIPQLWEEATPEERRNLMSPLVERV
jgi:hypothetical protein